MLAKKEKAVMKVVYQEAIQHDGKCLLRPVDFLKRIPYKLSFHEDELVPQIRGLALEDYFELVETERRGEMVYVFNLHQKGYAFIREIRSEQRAIKFKIILTISGVIMSFVLGRLLSLI